MGYDFIRKLTKGLPEEQAAEIAAALAERGIEVYTACEASTDDGHESTDSNVECEARPNRESGYRHAERDESQQDAVRYVLADASTRFHNGDIYVPAADRERAIKLLEQAGAADFICKDPVESLQMTEAQKLEADMLRRHRRNMVICLVLIVLAVIYYALT